MNSGEVGFTYGFREYYDATKNIRRTDGNQTYANAINIFDYNKKLYTTFDGSLGFGVNQCTTYNTSNTAVTGMLQPSTVLFQSFNLQTAKYIGVDTSASRYIPTKHYQFNQTRNSFTIVNDYYFDNVTGLPVRVIAHYPNFTMYFDWVNWVVQEQSASLFMIPPGCTFMTNTSTLAVLPPQNSTVDPNPLPANTPLPTLPTTFYAVAEGKIQVGGILESEVVGLNWYYDASSKTERADVVLDTYGNTNTQIFNYTSGLEFVKFDSPFCFTGEFNASTTAMSFLSATSTIGGPDIIHALFIPGAYSPLGAAFNPASAVYQNRTLVRGVNADCWKISVTSGPHIFDTYVYFFPKGWQFFGRKLSTDVVPMRVMTTGTTTINGVQATFFKEWDFFLYFSNAPDPRLLSSSLLGCFPTPIVFPIGNMTVTIPQQYSVFVAVTAVANGTTYAYEEITDQTKNMTRIYFYNGDQYVIDVLGNTVYGYYPYTGRQCITFPFSAVQLSNSQLSYVLTPAWQQTFFTSLAPFFVYNDTTTSARSILSDHYIFTIPTPTIGNFTFELFVDHVTLNPIRLAIKMPYIGEIVVEYLDWAAGPQNATAFTKPTQCLASSDYQSRLDNFTSNYNPSLPTNQTMPAVSSSFFMVLEGKLSGNSTGIEWWYDASAQQERVETFVDSTATPSVQTYDYVNNFAYSYSGSTCSNTSITGAADTSILAVTRSGFLHEFFEPTFKYATGMLTGKTSAYKGIFSVREVPAPMWQYPSIVVAQADGGTYNFNASVYFFPEGWNFPLRNLAPNTRVPLRILLTGIYVSPSQTVSVYSDLWDLFMYNPTAPVKSAFAPCAPSVLPLPSQGGTTTGSAGSTTSGSTTGSTATTSTGAASTAVPATTGGSIGSANDGSPGLSGGAKAGIAIAIIIAVLGLIIGVYLTVRAKRLSGGSAAAPSRAGQGRDFEQVNDEI